MDKTLIGGFDVLYLDTAGRLHTKANLMEELKKIRRVLGKKHPGAPHRSVLVLDATTGQNALSQTKLFDEAAGVDEIILTKLDGTAKGGVVSASPCPSDCPSPTWAWAKRWKTCAPSTAGLCQALLAWSKWRKNTSGGQEGSHSPPGPPRPMGRTAKRSESEVRPAVQIRIHSRRRALSRMTPTRKATPMCHMANPATTSMT